MRVFSRQGFTLLELSIVLTIIGLLVGGVMAGRALLRSSELKSVVDELNQYGSAVQQFVTEFQAEPGDMRTATDYWGSASGDGYNSTCYGITKTSELTCNGNGDRLISSSNPVTAAADGIEGYLAWHHLANANLVGGNFTGRGSNAGVNGTVGGISTPKSRMNGVTYIPYTFAACYSSNATYFDGCHYGDALYVGADASTSFVPGTFFTTEEMMSIDRKLDDALPGYGQFRSFKNGTCATDASNYALSTTGQICRGMFYLTPVRQN